MVSPPPVASKRRSAPPSWSFARKRNFAVPSRPLSSGSVSDGLADDFQMFGRGGADLDRRHAGGFEVIEDGKRGFEFIARRDEQGRVRLQDDRGFHQGGGLGVADGVGLATDRHHPEVAVEIIRHVPCHFAAFGTRLDDAGPEHDRRFLTALERIQVQRQRRIAVAVTTEGRRGLEETILGQQQVEPLLGAHFERLLAEEEIERPRELVGGDLVDALVHRVEHDPRRAVRGDAEARLGARPDFLRGVELERQLLLRGDHPHRRGGITQRAVKHLGLRGAAHEGGVDVISAFRVVRDFQAHAGRLGVGLEPLRGDDFLALDGDQSGPGVGRG